MPAIPPDSSSMPSTFVVRAHALRWAPAGIPVLDLSEVQIPPGVSWVGVGKGGAKAACCAAWQATWWCLAATCRSAARGWPTAAWGLPRAVFWMDPRTTAHDAVRGVDFLASTAARYPGWDAALLADLTQAFDLTPHLEKPLYMLSTGSKRKVWLAAALGVWRLADAAGRTFCRAGQRLHSQHAGAVARRRATSHARVGGGRLRGPAWRYPGPAIHLGD